MENRLKLNPGQERAAKVGSNTVACAGAGSGKTMVLVERYIRMLEEEGMDIDNIVAITFTRKAAGEMQERIRKAIQERIDCCSPEEVSVWKGRKDKLVSAHITTIDGFCASILRENPLEAGVDPEFQVLDPAEEEMVLNRLISDLLKKGLEEQQSHVEVLVDYYGIHRINEGSILVDSLKGLYNRIRTLGGDPEQAIEQAIEKVEDIMNEWVGQGIIEDIRSRLIGYLDALAGIKNNKFPGKKSYMLVEGRGEFKARLEQVDFSRDNWAYTMLDICRDMGEFVYMGDRPPDEVKAVLVSAKEDIDMVERYCNELASRELYRAVTLILSDLDREYRAYKEGQGVLDFSDLKVKALQVLGKESIAREYRERYRRFMVDEFQDTDYLQKEIIYRLVTEEGQLLPGRLFVVGDDKQSIYRFRGAEVEILHRVAQDVKRHSGGEHGIVSMDINYRTADEILHFINGLFGMLMNHLEDSASTIDYQDLLPVRRAVNAKPVEVHHIEREGDSFYQQEAGLIARRILAMVEGGDVLTPEEEKQGEAVKTRGVRYGDIAILLMVRTHLPEYEGALKELGIPYTVVEGIGFYQKQEVVDLINLLKVVNNRYDEIALAGVLRSPLFGISDNGLFLLKHHNKDYMLEDISVLHDDDRQEGSEARQVIEELRALRERVSIRELLEYALKRTHYLEVLLAGVNGIQKYSNVLKLLDIAGDFDSKNRGYALMDFIEYIQLMERYSDREGEAGVHSDNADAVKIMTVHQSKGLEFPVVIVPGLNFNAPGRREYFLFHRERGIGIKLKNSQGDPKREVSYFYDQIAREEDIKDREELKRLFYVAATRARDYLILTGETVKEDRRKAVAESSNLMEWLLEYLNRGGDELCRVNPPIKEVRKRPVYDEVPAVDTGREFSSEQLEGLLPLLKPVGRGRYSFKRVSPTQYLIRNKHPSRFRLQYVHRLGEEYLDLQQEGAGGSEGRLVGTLVHYCLEKGNSFEQAVEHIDRAMVQEGVDEGRREALKREVMICLKNYFDTEIESMFSGYACEREVEFFTRVGRYLINGFIDRVLVSKDEVVVIDYKTNYFDGKDAYRYKQELKDAYEAQVKIYMDAASKIYGKGKVRGFIHALRLSEDNLIEIEGGIDLEKVVEEVQCLDESFI